MFILNPENKVKMDSKIIHVCYQELDNIVAGTVADGTGQWLHHFSNTIKGDRNIYVLQLWSHIQKRLPPQMSKMHVVVTKSGGFTEEDVELWNNYLTCI